jgi:D-alanyl-D-alanine carboxypeptidase/D-alanyl-D-alanine-endopeptidase (penicillin-binding protein 4)
MRSPNSRSRQPRATARLPILLIAAALAACTPHPPRVHPTTPSTAIAPPPQTLTTDLDRIFDRPAFSAGFCAVVVQAADTGELLYTRNPDKLLLPASNMKILTLAAAVDRLTWRFQYETKLVATGPIEDGTLRGDLVIVGSGDPTIGEMRIAAAPKGTLDTWADELWSRGLRQIDGRIIGDGRALRARPYGAGWAWDDLVYGFAAPVSALQYHDNLVLLTIRPGRADGAPATMEIAPAESGLTIVNRIVTAAASSPMGIVLEREPGERLVTVSGRVPLGSSEIDRTVAVPDPPAFFARSLRAALVARGIRVVGAAIDMETAVPPPAEGAAQVLLTAQSPPLSGIASILMKDSENLYAETLLQTLAAVAPPVDGSGAAGAVRDLLVSRGLPPNGAIVADGSGLSRYDLVTARTLAGILRAFRTDPLFVDALAVGGTDGTLAHRFDGTSAAGRVRAKTGSMSHVRALSGYVTTDAGRPLVFSIIANNFDAAPSAITAAIDAAVVRLIVAR